MTKDDDKADTWLPPCCTDLPKAALTDEESVHTSKVLYESQNLQLHGAEEGKLVLA